MERFFKSINYDKVHGGTLTSFNKFIEEPNIISSSAIFSSFVGGYSKNKAIANMRGGSYTVLPKAYFCSKGGSYTTLPQEFFGVNTTNFIDNPTVTNTITNGTLARVGILTGGKNVSKKNIQYSKIFSDIELTKWIKKYELQNNIKLNIPRKSKALFLNIMNNVFGMTIIDIIQNEGKLSVKEFKKKLKQIL